MKKTFTTQAVLSIYTGINLCDNFDDVHEVFDHLCPGIMQPGMIAAAKPCAAELLRQHPEFGDLPPCSPESWECWTALAIEKLGGKLEVEGPLEVTKEQVSKYFDDAFPPKYQRELIMNIDTFDRCRTCGCEKSFPCPDHHDRKRSNPIYYKSGELDKGADPTVLIEKLRADLEDRVCHGRDDERRLRSPVTDRDEVLRGRVTHHPPIDRVVLRRLKSGATVSDRVRLKRFDHEDTKKSWYEFGVSVWSSDLERWSAADEWSWSEDGNSPKPD